MRVRPLLPLGLSAAALLGSLAPAADAYAMADPALAYETVEPARIKLGQFAVIRITSLDGFLQNVTPPTVPGLTFEILGRTQGLEFVGGRSTPAWYIIMKVTPQFVGVFTIPGLTPKSPTVGLEVYTGDQPNPYAFKSQKPTANPAPMSKAPVPRGIHLEAGGAAFIQMVMPNRPVYVGESVPVDIELGLQPGVVTSLNGPPALSGSDFTLNNLSKQPLRREQMIEGSPFLVMTWHSALAAVKPGEFSLSVEAPLSVRVDVRSAEDKAFANMMGWPFTQIPFKGVAPKDVTIASTAAKLKVLSLPAQGRPKDFSGAVGNFQVTSDASATRVAAGDPLTLRLHISGEGNFDRVDAAMLDHLDHWKTYPAKSAFKSGDAAGNKGEKVFEQPLIAAQPGAATIPPLEFSYFNPNTQHYERARTAPINVTVVASLADSAPGAARVNVSGLRPDHPRPQRTFGQLLPLYFQPPFLAVPGSVVLILAGCWLAFRPRPAGAPSKSLARLEQAAASGTGFFETARETLLQAFAARWRIPAAQINTVELRARLGAGAAEVERLFALADEAKYSNEKTAEADYQRWLAVVRGHL